MTLEQPQSHPLQKYVNSVMNLVGLAVAVFLMLMTVVSTFLLIDSARKVSELVGHLTVAGVILAWLVYSYLVWQIQRSGIRIIHLGSSRPLEASTLIHYFLLACGFFQTVFWVMQPSDSNHEPRSVLILLSAGLFAYFRYQIQENVKFNQAQANQSPTKTGTTS